MYPGDEILLEKRFASHSCNIPSFEEYIADQNFGLMDADHRYRLHLGLLPHPYAGNLKTAQIFILMQNPGFHETDYYAEYESAEFREAHLRGLRQVNERDKYPFVFLDPRFCFHAGAVYWLKKFWKLIDQVRVDRALNWTEALSVFSRAVATLECVPYHSRSFRLPRSITDALQSKSDMLEYVHQELVPRARKGEVLLISARHSGIWHLPDHRNLVIYEGTASRAAHLTPGTKGGDAILGFLKKR